MATMRAIRFHEHGGPEVLKVERAPKPSPKEGQLLIKIHATGINPFETYVREGQFAKKQVPHILGMDCAGVVDELGPGVTQFKVGDRVFTCGTLTGAYCEYTVAVPRHTCKLPDSLTFAQGASIGVPYFTAYKALALKSNPKKGDVVLIHGASGAVGLAAVQMCKSLGATVFGTAGSQEGLALVKRVGADQVFNHREDNYQASISQAAAHKGGVDVILEMLANVNLQKDLELVGPRGKVILIGCRGKVEINPLDMFFKESSVQGLALMSLEEGEWEQIKTGMEDALAAGWVQPVVGQEYKFDDIAQAHIDLLGSKATLGKLVLDIGANQS